MSGDFYAGIAVGIGISIALLIVVAAIVTATDADRREEEHDPIRADEDRIATRFKRREKPLE